MYTPTAALGVCEDDPSMFPLVATSVVLKPKPSDFAEPSFTSNALVPVALPESISTPRYKRSTMTISVFDECLCYPRTLEIRVRLCVEFDVMMATGYL